MDNFAWPSGCARLRMVAAEPLEQLAAALEAGLEQGRQVVALSGCRRGDGCTTLLLAVARRLAERGLKVAMVDADFANPLLARRLGLLPEAGWEEVLVGGLPVQEALIESLQEGLAVLPWCGSLQGQALPAAESPKLASRLDVLREYYDLVLVDLGRFASGQEDDDRDGGDAAGLLTAWVDAVVLVHDVRSTPPAELERVRQRVAAAGLVEAGIAENFVEFRGSA